MVVGIICGSAAFMCCIIIFGAMKVAGRESRLEEMREAARNHPGEAENV